MYEIRAKGAEQRLRMCRYPSDKLLLGNRLLDIIDTDTDSLIFYNLGAEYSSRIEQFGLQRHLPVDEVMII